jgi:hypothetical protein
MSYEVPIEKFKLVECESLWSLLRRLVTRLARLLAKARGDRRA